MKETKENKNASTIQNFDSLTKMATLCLQEEMLPEKVEGSPVLYDDKRVKIFKGKDSVQNAGGNVADKITVLKKLVFCVRNS